MANPERTVHTALGIARAPPSQLFGAKQGMLRGA